MHYNCCQPCKLFITGVDKPLAVGLPGKKFCVIAPSICFMSPFWRQNVCGGLWVSGKFVIRGLDLQPTRYSAF